MIKDYWKIWVDNGVERSLEDLQTPDNVQSDDYSLEEACIIAADELSWKADGGESLCLLVQGDDKFYEVSLQKEWVYSHCQDTTIDIITGNY